MPDSDLEKTLDWNGGKITERGVLLFIVQHIAQHLGQQIRLCSLGRRRPAVDTRPAPEELVLKRLATVNRCKQAITQNP